MDTDSNGMLYILGLASDARLTVTRNLDALDDNALKIENEAGSELPSTGGIGTTIFYMIGAMLVIGAGVILVTRRKMDA